MPAPPRPMTGTSRGLFAADEELDVAIDKRPAPNATPAVMNATVEIVPHVLPVSSVLCSSRPHFFCGHLSSSSLFAEIAAEPPTIPMTVDTPPIESMTTLNADDLPGLECSFSRRSPRSG